MTQTDKNDTVVCGVCPHGCTLGLGHNGLCGVRECRNGQSVSKVYGKCTGLCVDPIEKKPLYHFLPGSKTLSLGTIGCNLHCVFCQNAATSWCDDITLCGMAVSPDQIADVAVKHGCQSVAFTYNEPIVWMEFVVDTATVCRNRGIPAVAVTAGYLHPSQYDTFFSPLAAVNIDLKAFTEDFYRTYCRATLEPVKETLCYVARKASVWLEVTTLLIPGLNDDPQTIADMAKWIRRNLGAETPLHFSAFHPTNLMTDRPATPPQTLRMARETAMAEGLKNVYTGNIRDISGQTTYCPQCRHSVILRDGFDVTENKLDEDSCCTFCGQTIAGQWKDTHRTELRGPS